MKCGNCNNTSFEVVMGQVVCVECGSNVDNETATAISLGLSPSIKNEMIVPKEEVDTIRGIDDAT